jgi:hypothetical protein
MNQLAGRITAVVAGLVVAWPTDLPFDLDRLITVTILVAGAALAMIVAVEVVMLLRQPPTARSMASSSSS